MSKHKTKRFKLSKKDVRDFCYKKQYATMMFDTASNDYIASRCCILNKLVSAGLILSCQSIEKILKAFIFLETEEKLKEGHDPFELKEKLKEVKDYKLDKFDDLLKRLYGHYQSRYYNNKNHSKIKSSKEIDEIDELWVYLIEIFPVPDEVKYRLMFFARLFEKRCRKYLLDYYWIEKNNKALAKKIKEMELKYKAVFQHLYPKIQQK